MKKVILLFTVITVIVNLFLIVACDKEQLSEEMLIGTWKHPIEVGAYSINDGENVPLYTYEILQLKGDGSFVFGEYGKHPLYEVKGNWKLSDDKTRLEMSFDDGETSSIDIREFNGNSFITTSREGNDFKYVKE